MKKIWLEVKIQIVLVAKCYIELLGINIALYESIVDSRIFNPINLITLQVYLSGYILMLLYKRLVLLQTTLKKIK